MNSESVLDCLEAAFEEEWMPIIPEIIPEALRDPLVMMERGRRLLREGLRIPPSLADIAVNDEEYRAAARNGTAIPEDVLARMHEEREEAERGMPGSR